MIGEIARSLYRRMFWDGHLGNQAEITGRFLRTMAELGETAQVLSKWFEFTTPDVPKLRVEAADLVVSAVCSALTITGSIEELEEAIRAKLRHDEERGALHAGQPLRGVPAWLRGADW